MDGIDFSPLMGEGTIIRNNVLTGWTSGSMCFFLNDAGSCMVPPSSGATISNNAVQGSLGFVNLGSNDFHLTSSSPLIDAGYNLGQLNPDDYDGKARPKGAGYDIGAYESSSAP